MSYFSPSDLGIDPAPSSGGGLGKRRGGGGQFAMAYAALQKEIQAGAQKLEAALAPIQSQIDAAKNEFYDMPEALGPIEGAESQLASLQAVASNAVATAMGPQTDLNVPKNEVLEALGRVAAISSVVARARASGQAQKKRVQDDQRRLAAEETARRKAEDELRQREEAAEARRLQSEQYAKQLEEARMQRDYEERQRARESTIAAEDRARQADIDRAQRAEAAAAAREQAQLQAQQGQQNLVLQQQTLSQEAEARKYQIEADRLAQQQAIAEAQSQRQYEIEQQRLQWEMERQTRSEELAAEQAARAEAQAEKMAYMQAIATLPESVVARVYGGGDGGPPTMPMSVGPAGGDAWFGAKGSGLVPLESYGQGQLFGMDDYLYPEDGALGDYLELGAESGLRGLGAPVANTPEAADKMALVLAGQAKQLRASGNVAAAKALEAKILELQAAAAKLRAPVQPPATDWFGTGLKVGGLLLALTQGPKLVKKLFGGKR